MVSHAFAENRAELLTGGLFSLADPWQGRFLTFVAQKALGEEWDGNLPTEEEVTSWLGKKEGLRKTVMLLLSRWQKN
jgi:hypothetical protein